MQKDFQNTLYTNDNLFILNGLNSNLVDLIYLDPPFNTKRVWSAPVGSKAAGTSFKDMWAWEDVNEAYLETLTIKYPALTRFITTVGQIHSKAMMAYLTYMVQRIIEMHRVLKDTGSLYLHCDPTAGHYLKIVLDEIFGKNNFRNEIVWYNPGGLKVVPPYFPHKHDTIYLYCKNNPIFNTQKKATAKNSLYKRWINYSKNGEYITYAEFPRTDKVKFDMYVKRFISQNKREPMDDDILYRFEGAVIDDVWADCPSVFRLKEKTGYPTQKPLSLLRRVIEASSNVGDIVLDPFCGCATACVAAQQLGRRWIGIDVEENAVKILVDRLSDDSGLFKNFISTKLVPQRTDIQIVLPSATVKKRLYKEQKGKCNGCGIEFEIRNLEIDHIIPKAKGGVDYYENYQLLCGSCNRIKGSRPMDYLRMKIKVREEMLGTQVIFGE